MPGQTTQTVTVQASGDLTDEPSETFNVNLSMASNATVADAQGVGTILNDDSLLPALNISDATGLESGTVGFTVSLNPASTQTVTVQYQTANGTAVAGVDYTAASGTVTFMPGQTTRPVIVNAVNDTVDEDNETFVVNLSNATNAAIVDGQGVGTLTDDDPLPALAINDVNVNEGNTGTINLVFNVTLNNASGRTVTVNYATSDGTATTGAGPGGSDYLATSGTLTFTAGMTSQTVSVVVNGDAFDEANETILVALSGATNANVADAQGIGTINDDDAPPSVTINDVQQAEGNSFGFNAFVFTVSLTPASGRNVSVTYATATGTAMATDFAGAMGTVSFAAGETAKTVTVQVFADRTLEQNETFFVNLTGATNANIADNQGQGTIVNDD